MAAPGLSPTRAPDLRAALALLITGKTALDSTYHMREHRQARHPVPVTAVAGTPVGELSG